MAVAGLTWLKLSKLCRVKSSCAKALLPALFRPYLNHEEHIHSQVISKNITIKKPGTQFSSQSERSPLVLLLSWLMSKEKHLEKYEQVYLSQGFNVLKVRLTPTQLMFPSVGAQLVAKDTAEWLAKHDEYTDITVHGFSVGGYLFGELLNVINSSEGLKDRILSRVRAQIFDSVVAMKGIPTAFPRAITSNPTMIKLLEIYVKTHLHVLAKTATQHYENSFDQFCNQNFRIPTLFFMSKADKLGCHHEMLRLVNKWKSEGVPVNYKIWEDSPHCSHYLHHPKDYTEAVAQLLESIGLLADRDTLPVITPR